MPSNAISQGVLCRDDAVNDFSLWPKREVLRIEALSEQQVLSELQEIMEGRGYSWYSINELLQDQLDKEALEFTFIDGDILFEWNNLCDEKRNWERKGCLSADCAEFNRDCLINLKILPFQARLGLKNSQLVTTNIDKSNPSTMDLWVGMGKLELESSTDNDNESTDNDESMPWMVGDSEDSDKDVYYECTGHADFEDNDVIGGREDEDEEDEDAEVDAELFEEDEDIEDIEIFEEYFEEEDDESEED